jgi:hypothetical protein
MHPLIRSGVNMQLAKTDLSPAAIEEAPRIEAKSKQNRSKTEAKSKQNRSKTEAKSKQNRIRSLGR